MTDSESTPPSSGQEEAGKTETQGGQENIVAGESAKLLEQRARELQSHIQSFGDEVRALATNMEARKRETTVLKIMLYTGVVILMVAFFYSSNALYDAQLKSFEANLNHMQGMMQANLDAVERGFKKELVTLEQQVIRLESQQAAYYLKEEKLAEVLLTLDEAVGPLAKNNPELAEGLAEIQKNSGALSQAYLKKKEAQAGSLVPPVDPPLIIYP